jgi:putative membrane protein
MWEYMSNLGWGWIGLGAIHMLVFWGLIILLIVVLIRLLGALSEARGGDSAGKSPLDILRERYARGEIQEDEFERKKRKLRE